MRTPLPPRRLAFATALLLTLRLPGGMSSAAGSQPEGSGASNVRVSRDSYPVHAEPSIAVNPRNAQNLLGASMLLGKQTTLLGTFVSFDGGQTWHDNGPLPLPQGTKYGDDVTVAFDANGTGFVDAMATSGQARQDRGVYVWRTDDGGRTFHSPVAAMKHQFADHPWLTADDTAGTGGGNLYAAWVAEDHQALGFTRSSDGGRSFAAPRDISTPPGGVSIPAVAAGPGGAVYVVFESGRQGAGAPAEPDADARGDRMAAASNAPVEGRASQAGADAQVEVVNSTDYGRSFGQPVVLGPVPSMVAVSPQLDLSTGPSISVDPRTGIVYVTYVAYRRGSTHTDVLVSSSRDDGRTWSTPIRASGTPHPGDAIYFQPQVVVDGAGAVDVTYFALAHGRVDMILVRSTTHGTGFTTRRPVTSHSFDPELGIRGSGKGGKDSLWWIGDYQGLAAGPDMIHPFWNDTRPGRLEIYTAAVPAGAFR